MSAFKHRFGTVPTVAGVYLLFLIGYWQLPFVMFSTEENIDNCRQFYMGMFSAIVILACLFGKKWIPSIILVLISLALVFPKMLMPLGLNFRESAYIFPNFMIVTFGFTMLFVFISETLKRATVTKGAAATAFAVILVLQIINPLTLVLFAGPR